MNGLTKGDRVRVTWGATTSVYAVRAVFEDLIVVFAPDGGGAVAIHIRYHAGLGAWTLGGRKVEIAKEPDILTRKE